MSLSVIIPCYNEEAVLPKLREELEAAVETWPHPAEFVCIDDGSKDRTLEILRRFHEEDDRWKVVSFARNFGHQTAVSAGIAHASGDAVMVIDADLQDPPSLLMDFIAKWQEGYDVVYGVRKNRKEPPLLKAAYWLFYRMISRLIPFDFPVDAGDFCLMSRRVVEEIRSMPERNRYVRGLRAWVGFRQIGLPYERPARAAGETKYNFGRLLKLALDGIISFSAVPLKAATWLGLIIAALSGFGAIFTLVQRIFADFFASIGLAPTPGFATIVIAILFLGGIQLLFLGVFGEYLQRIFDEVKQRPGWVVRERLGAEDQR